MGIANTPDGIISMESGITKEQQEIRQASADVAKQAFLKWRSGEALTDDEVNMLLMHGGMPDAKIHEYRNSGYGNAELLELL